MAVDTLPIAVIKYPDPRLRRKCVPFEEFDGALAALAQRMLELMHAGRGVGLAAAQVGVSRRIIVCNPTGEPADDLVFVNPVISDLLGAVEAEEGCLSVPDVLVKIRRARKCRIDACDVQGKRFAMEGEGLLARIWQHEIDHLDGRLIIDRMNETDRIAYKKLLADLEAEFRRKSRKR